MGPGATPEDHGPRDPLSQPLDAFSDKESQSEFKSTLRTEYFLFLSFFLPSALSCVHLFLPFFLSFFLPSFPSFFSSYTRVVFTLLEAGVPPSLKKAFLSPHSPADRATPAVAKLRLPRGPGKDSEYAGRQVTKGPGRPAPFPAHPTHVQERDHREILPGVKQGGAVFLQPWRSPEDPQSHTSRNTHTQPFKIPPFPLFSSLPCTPTNCHAQA